MMGTGVELPVGALVTVPPPPVKVNPATLPSLPAAAAAGVAYDCSGPDITPDVSTASEM
jgi:hypothetical protein